MKDLYDVKHINFIEAVNEIENYAIFLLDIYDHIESANKGAEKIMGYTRAEMEGKNFRLFHTVDDINSGKPGLLFHQAASEGKAYDEGWLIRKNGSLFRSAVTIIALRDHTGNTIGFSGIIHELKAEPGEQHHHIPPENEDLFSANEKIQTINEELNAANEELSASIEELQTANEEMEEATKIIRLQGEELLRKSEEKINIILASINEIVWAVDFETNALNYISDGILNLYGLDSQQVTKDPTLLFSIIHPDDRQKLINAREENKTNDFFKIEFRIIHAKSGQTRWIESKSWKHYDKHKKPEFRLGVARDITDVKEALLLMVESEKKYKTLFENNPMPLLISDPQTLNILDANHTICVKYGYPKEEFLKLNLSDIRSPKEDQVYGQSTAASIENSIHSNISFSIHRTKSGKAIDVLSITNEITYEGKKALIVFISDISTQKRLEGEREELVKRLMLRNKELEDYSYIISHHIRTPVVDILGLVELVGMEGLEQSIIENLLASAKNLDAVIYDMNEILANNSEAFDNIEKIFITNDISAITGAFNNKILNAGARVNIECEQTTFIYSNRLCFHKVISGLLDNALKYRSAERLLVINIRCFISEGYVCVSIEDNGRGIDLNRFGKKLFGLFKRFHFDTQGKGLNLYLLKNQVERLGGKIEVESEVDVGTKFMVYFKK